MMSVWELLAGEDRESVTTFLVRKNPRLSKYPCLSLDWFITQWEETVTDIEQGRLDNFDEYVNSLDGRRIIEEVRSVLTEDGSRVISEVVRTSDERFLVATDSMNQQIYNRDTRYWWYHRAPKKAHESFFHGMHSQGYE